MKLKKKLLIIASAIVAVLVISFVGVTKALAINELNGKAKLGELYQVKLDGAISSDSTEWHGFFRKGKENKVLVCFFGGGCSVNEYTAARSNAMPGGFYFYQLFDAKDKALGAMAYTFFCTSGVLSPGEENPFHDWTIIVVPYATADFHCGTNDFPYTALDGTKKILYHHGYTNVDKLMKAVMPQFTEAPEALVVTGYSAGGFGTALLADHIIDFFPKTKNVTVCVDSGLLLNSKWRQVVTDVWKAPQSIARNVKTDNLTLDCLKALDKKRNGMAKILFCCSPRDTLLALSQTLFDRGNHLLQNATKKDGDRFQGILKTSVKQMLEALPKSGIFIFADLEHQGGTLTKHTIVNSKEVFNKRDQGMSVAQWLMDAVDGKVRSYGLQLLDKGF